MDISIALNRTIGILSYDLMYSRIQIVEILETYYKDEFSHIFTTNTNKSNKSFSYQDDVVFVEALQNRENCKWILIDDLQTFLESTLAYRMSMIQERGKGILFLTHFGITQLDLAKLSSLCYQSMYLSVQPMQGLEIKIYKSPQEVLDQLLTLGFYGKQKYGFLTCNIEWYKDYLCKLEYPSITWEPQTSIDKPFMCEYTSWTEKEDGVFFFNQVPPLPLKNLNTIYILDGWDESSLWLTIYQAYLLSQRNCPLYLNILITNVQQQKAYDRFIESYSQKAQVIQSFTTSLPVTVCPKQKRLLMDLPIF